MTEQSREDRREQRDRDFQQQVLERIDRLTTEVDKLSTRVDKVSTDVKKII
ncbi:MAG: hypothetical protein HC780_08725 [Leptolyngbyaceae cyanobacterium CSU_1_3]|nr:hypothetical protein [Leptolyngbyaceae cyanobacterium CSU_1_3]